MNELFNMTFGRIFHLLTDSPMYTLYAFFCTIIFCIIFQIFFLNKAARKNRVCLSTKHFIWVYIFLFYLTYVYQATGIGTIWMAGRYDTLIREEIALIPFQGFNGIHSLLEYGLNIVMTMPFGFLLPLIWPELRSIKKVAFTGFSFSLLIELSQLLNRRATTTEDLIMNTLGVILGCLIYRHLHRVIYRTNNFRPTRRTTSPIVTHEAIIYLACSFLGMFLFFNSLLILPFSTSDASDSIISISSMNTSTHMEGTIVKISDNRITMDSMETIVLENGSTSISNSGPQEDIIVTEQTTIEIWQTDLEETLDPIITPVPIDTLSEHDLIAVTGQKDSQGFIAEKIVIWKFDRES